MGSSSAASSTKRSRWHQNEKDVLRWAELFRGGASVVHIAARERVAPSTVSSQFHKLGIDIKQGQHHVLQLPLKYSEQFVQLVKKGPDAVIDFASARVWGIGITDVGRKQVQNFCEFTRLHQEGVGVEEIARRLALHRSTVAEWREGTDQPYIIKAASNTLPFKLRPGWKMLPMHLASGGSEPSGWIQVPIMIQSSKDVGDVVNQLRPLGRTYECAASFGLSSSQIEAMRVDLFAYLLGIMVGDSGKLGGAQKRYSSMNLDLQLTRKRDTNERMGAFVILCANSLGIEMGRIKDKPPTGRQLLGKQPTPSFRWSSDRSPLLAWMFTAGLGLRWGETTTTHPVRMPWIFDTSRSFRIRFIQGAADSDGCVKRSEVEIASVPNARLFAEILQSVGMTTAHISYEKGQPLKTMVNRKQASNLPIFNEFVRSYRYQKMLGSPQSGQSPSLSLH